jgi:hypothetical protein
MKPRIPWIAYLAAALGLLFAVPSVYWALGGTWLLDTLGGAIEERARARDGTLIVVTWVTAILKVIGGLLPLAMVQPWGRRFPRKLMRFAAWIAAGGLVLYGAVQTLAVGLVYLEVVPPEEHLEQRALRWRLFLWEPWFLVWGVALGLTAWTHGRTDRDPLRTQGSDG